MNQCQLSNVSFLRTHCTPSPSTPLSCVYTRKVQKYKIHLLTSRAIGLEVRVLADTPGHERSISLYCMVLSR
jgi:hypothetical protein